MKIVIVGVGKVGLTLVHQLSLEGHNIIAIDTNQRVIENLMNSHDAIGILGNGASYAAQEEADVAKADLLIAVTSTDELNLLCCMVAKKFGCKNTTARIRNPEYLSQRTFMRDELGVNMVVNPEFAAARAMSQVLRLPSALNIDVFARGRVDLVELVVPQNSKLDGQILAKMYQKFKVKILVCAVQRNQEVIIPTGDFVIQAGDKINITATPAAIVSFFKELGILKEKVRSVMLVGGSNICYYLAKQLCEAGMSVKIIERDEKKCIKLCEILPKAMIIQGDGSDYTLLEEEAISKMDAFVALTGIDEENVILSLYAKRKNVRKVVTKVNKHSINKLLVDSDLGSIISPKYITANQIVTYVRGLQNSLGSGVKTMHKIINNRVEALEFVVRVNTKFIGIPLKQLKLKDNLLVACIIRNNKAIIPGGEDTIEAGDSVIVVTTIPYLREFNDIIK